MGKGSHMSGANGRTVRDLRRTNRATLLRHLYFEGPLSRQELGPVTRLSSATVSNVTSELLAEGALEEAGSVGSDGGRPRTLLRVAPGAGTLIGVDVGETRVRVELFDLALTERARVEYPLSDGGHDLPHVVRLIAEGLRVVRDVRDGQVGRAGQAGRADPASSQGEGAEDDGTRPPGPLPSAPGTLGATGPPGTPSTPGPLLGVGIGVPGIVEPDPARGAMVHGQTIGWEAVPLETLLRQEAALPEEIPIHVSNGAKTLGQAETWFGAGRGVGNAVVVLLGSGVGASVITNGSAYGTGSRGAGEWGHTTVRIRGRRCRCGASGCLEAYVGAAAVLERWREAGGAPEGDEESALAQLLAARDPAATAVLDDTAEYLGAGIADLVNLFSPERVVLAGWAGLLLGARLLPAVREATTAHALRYPAARATVELGRLGEDAVTVGAATLPLTRFLDHGGHLTPPGAAPRAGARVLP